MKIVAVPKAEAKVFMSDVPWAAISIADIAGTHPPLNKCQCIKVLQLDFLDLDTPDEKYICEKQKQYPQDYANATWFRPAHAHQILDFFEEVKNDIQLLLVHCVAGRCRSPAVAAALAKIHTGDDNKYFKAFTPNMLVYRTILNEAFDRQLWTPPNYKRN